MAESKDNLPVNFGVLLYPTFQALDVFGPLDALNLLSLDRSITLSLLARTLDPVSTAPQPSTLPRSVSMAAFSESVVPTHTLTEPAAAALDVLLVPGGLGSRAPDLDAEVAFLARTFPSLKYLITVCTGSALAAQAGVLDGRRATSNKAAWAWVTAQGERVHWVAHARWVRDGNVWTTAGVSAGIDGTLAWMAEVYGEEAAQKVADRMEYVRVTDPEQDPFAGMYGVQDVPAKK